MRRFNVDSQGVKKCEACEAVWSNQYHIFLNQYLGSTVMSPLDFAMNGCVDTKETKSGNPKVHQIFRVFSVECDLPSKTMAKICENTINQMHHS